MHNIFMYLSILEISENMYMEKILAVEHEIRIGKGVFAKSWQV